MSQGADSRQAGNVYVWGGGGGCLAVLVGVTDSVCFSCRYKKVRSARGPFVLRERIYTHAKNRVLLHSKRVSCMRLQTPPATPRPRESSRYLTPPATPGRGARELRTPGFSYNTRGNTDVEKDDAREAESELMSVGKEVEGLTPRVHKGLNTMLERYRPLEVDDAVADATRAIPPAAGSFTATAGSIDAMMMVDAESAALPQDLQRCWADLTLRSALDELQALGETSVQLKRLSVAISECAALASVSLVREARNVRDRATERMRKQCTRHAKDAASAARHKFAGSEASHAPTMKPIRPTTQPMIARGPLHGRLHSLQSTMDVFGASSTAISSLRHHDSAGFHTAPSARRFGISPLPHAFRPPDAPPKSPGDPFRCPFCSGGTTGGEVCATCRALKEKGADDDDDGNTDDDVASGGWRLRDRRPTRQQAPLDWFPPEDALECADDFDARCSNLAARATTAFAVVHRHGGQMAADEASFRLRRSLFEVRAAKLSVQPLRMRALLSPRTRHHSRSLVQQPLRLAAGIGGGPWMDEDGDEDEGRSGGGSSSRAARQRSKRRGGAPSAPFWLAVSRAGGGDDGDAGGSRWSLAKSIWAPRKKWSDSKSLHDDDECLRRAIVTDWRAARKASAATDRLLVRAASPSPSSSPTSSPVRGSPVPMPQGSKASGGGTEAAAAAAADEVQSVLIKNARMVCRPAESATMKDSRRSHPVLVPRPATFKILGNTEPPSSHRFVILFAWCADLCILRLVRLARKRPDRDRLQLLPQAPRRPQGDRREQVGGLFQLL